MQKSRVESIIDRETIEKRIKELGDKISADYEGKEIVMIGILNGAVIFYGELAKNISGPVKMDFMRVSSYGASTATSGNIMIIKDAETDIAGRDVLIIEDIVDTGLTLSTLKRMLGARKPSSLKICCMLDKPSRRKVEMKADYVGFEIADRFVVGYGLDYNEKYRNLPYIGELKAD
jgi:hypoxanthine phosphoribosyltransferase